MECAHHRSMDKRLLCQEKNGESRKLGALEEKSGSGVESCRRGIIKLE